MKIQYINEWVDTEEVDDNVGNEDDETLANSIVKDAQEAIINKIKKIINVDNIINYINDYRYERANNDMYNLCSNLSLIPGIKPSYIVSHSSFLEEEAIEIYKSLIDIDIDYNNHIINIILPFNFFDINTQIKILNAQFKFDESIGEILGVAYTTINCVDELRKEINDKLKNSKVNNYHINIKYKILWFKENNKTKTDFYNFINMKIIVPYSRLKQNKELSQYCINCINLILSNTVNIDKLFKIGKVSLSATKIHSTQKLVNNEDGIEKIIMRSIGDDIDLDIFEKDSLEKLFSKIDINVFEIMYKKSCLYKNPTKIIETVQNINNFPKNTLLRYPILFNLPHQHITINNSECTIWDVKNSNEMESFLQESVYKEYAIIKKQFYNPDFIEHFLPFDVYKELFYNIWNYQNWKGVNMYSYRNQPGLLFKYTINEPFVIKINVNLRFNTISYVLENCPDELDYIGPTAGYHPVKTNNNIVLKKIENI